MKHYKKTMTKLLGEGTFLYDVAQEKLYVTISEDGVTCSTSDAADAPADVPPVLTLPILDEIDTSVTVGTSGSSLSYVQAAVKLLDSAGCEEVEITWGSDPVEPVEAIMQTAGLRK